MTELMDLFDIRERSKKDVVKHGYKLFPNAPDLQVITQISATSYERNECKDKNLVFIPSFEYNNDSTKINELDIHISNETNLCFSLPNVRLLRKMLQPINDSHCLVFGQNDNDDYKVIGICKLSEIVEKCKCYVFTIKKHMKWYLRIGNVDALGYENGIFKSVFEMQNEINAKDEVDKIKKAISNIDEKTFEKLINTLINQKHGTSFVIFEAVEKAIKEAKRLASQNVGRGFLLSPELDFNEQNITQITDIDGGLIFDSQAKCYAYGCIFDGKVPKNGFEGNSGRGSRFNSVKLYVQTTKECVGVIYSDDNTIDVIAP